MKENEELVNQNNYTHFNSDYELAMGQLITRSTKFKVNHKSYPILTHDEASNIVNEAIKEDLANKTKELKAATDAVSAPAEKFRGSQYYTAYKKAPYEKSAPLSYSVGIDEQLKSTKLSAGRNGDYIQINNDCIKFILSEGTEILRFELGGDIYVKGEFAQSDAQVVDGIRAMLRYNKYIP